MLARQILLAQFDRLTRELNETLADLTTDQLNHRPGNNAMSLGFNAWHVFRTMDNVVNFVLQRKQPVWLADGYVDRLELPKNAQGTGMDHDEAKNLTINDPDVLRDYARAALASCRDYIATASEDDLLEAVAIRPMGEMPRWRALAEIVISHSAQHLGEMSMGRGLLGLRGAAEPVAG